MRGCILRPILLFCEGPYPAIGLLFNKDLGIERTEPGGVAAPTRFTLLVEVNCGVKFGCEV